MPYINIKQRDLPIEKVFKDKWRLHLSKKRTTFTVTVRGESLTKDNMIYVSSEGYKAVKNLNVPMLRNNIKETREQIHYYSYCIML